MTTIRPRTLALLVLGALAILPCLAAPALAAPASVQNPGLEQVTAGKPNCFTRAGWGSNTAAWALTASAHSGSVAQSLTVSNYAGGDEKLITTESASCAPGVTAGQSYALSVWYRSTAQANSLTVFRHTASGWSYWTDLKALPSASVWTQAIGATPAVPAGTDQLAFGVSLAGNGTLVTDDYSLTQVAAPPPQTPGELTHNPGLEQVTAGKPDCFSQKGWGSNAAAWALTSDAHTGSVAQSLTVSNYAGGDEKLLTTESDSCAPAVSVGQSYSLSVWYRSTAQANSLTLFRHSAAGWTYWTELEALPAAAGWTQATATTPALPAGTDELAFGVSLSGNGTLLTDDYSLTQLAAPPPPPPPSGELTQNPGLEQGGAVPDGWSLAGWGDGTVTSGVTSDAHGGSRAYSISLVGRTQGDYKLLPAQAQSPAVQPGATYHLSVWYRSTAPTNGITVFAHTAAGWGYYTDLSTLPAAASWTKASVDTPPIDAGIDAIAWAVSIASNGTLITDDYSTTLASTPPPPPQTGPADQGQWTVTDRPMPIRAMHATVLDTGKVLLIAGSGNSPSQFAAGTFRAAVWDPVSDTFNQIAVPKDMFCSGHVTLPDGRVLIQGGTRSYPSPGGAADYSGLRDSYIFDPQTETFTKAADANEGHWYPTLTELGNGDVWMGGGLKEDTSGAVNTEMWSSQQSTWLPTGQVPQTWSFWGLYPHMFLMSDGRLFYSGGHVFGNGLPGTGASIYNWQTASIADVPGLRSKDLRDQSASVLLPPAQSQQVLIAGGGNINTNTPAISYCDVISLNDPNPAYHPAPDLPGMGKMYVNSTILPDRTVLTSNGGRFNRDDSANVLTAAIYDPQAGSWKSVAADPIGRNYHSAAVLLPDGRVAVFGSNPGDGTFELRVSIYQPPYLFKGTRPLLSGVPAQATYGSQFGFGVQADTTIRWAQFMRPSSATHQMDSNSRLVDLPITVTNGVATVSVPSNRNLLPPGPYMLNVTDSKGVPSESAWVMVH